MNDPDPSRHAREIFQAGVEAVEPRSAVLRHVTLLGDELRVAGRAYDLAAIDRVYVVGMGKAAAVMALALEDLLWDRIRGGMVSVKHGHRVPLKRIQVREASHPIPDAAGVGAATEMASLLAATGPRDLVFCVISGGGSALLPAPAEGLTLEDKQETTRQLLACGATIQEINAIRKHLSRLKGGRLARLAEPSTLASLVLSDVVGDPLDAIASGPTVPDPTTFQDCLTILARYGLERGIPERVRRVLDRGIRGELSETPKPGDTAFERTQNLIVGSNALALDAARGKAQALGYNTLILSGVVEGETRDVARNHAAIARGILATGNPVPRPACVLSGGETTVTIRGPGRGGRNQEFALAAALEVDGVEGVLLFSGATDGTDGPTDAAGAWADGSTVTRGSKAGLDAAAMLRANDSHTFFRGVGDLLVTGPTRTNVMDLRIVLVP
ncbi:MAG TPA: glycerate kinase [Longimicrobiales bacterium]|nr:glycerate kinase [Longimicrobiales bacterium]